MYGNVCVTNTNCEHKSRLWRDFVFYACLKMEENVRQKKSPDLPGIDYQM